MVTRYRLAREFDDSYDMEESKHGAWVDYADYQDLERQLRLAKKEMESLQEKYDALWSDYSYELATAREREIERSIQGTYG